MAVTKQTYTATGTWTAAQLANIFKDAFIDAGLMVDWHDSFLSGSVENRVLEVVYDASKTYGTVYYWFMFTTSGAFIHTALAWDTTSKVPSGTQYLDYFSITTNATTNHRTLLSLSSTTSTTLTRYTSSVNTDCSWFLLRDGTSNQAFFVPGAGFGPTGLIDLNKTAFNGMIHTSTATSAVASTMEFSQSAGHTRRTYLGATALRGSTTASAYISTIFLYRYLTIGNASASSTNFSTSSALTGVWLPTAHVNTNTALAADHIPVFSGPTVSPYLAAMPSDFGIAPYYASNSMAAQDTLVVTSGTEEWEMLSVGLNGNTNASRILFLARVV
jgi:hypothetical protein